MCIFITKSCIRRNEYQYNYYNLFRRVLLKHSHLSSRVKREIWFPRFRMTMILTSSLASLGMTTIPFGQIPSHHFLLFDYIHFSDGSGILAPVAAKIKQFLQTLGDG